MGKEITGESRSKCSGSSGTVATKEQLGDPNCMYGRGSISATATIDYI
jgi:hypothetical protein